MTFLPLSVTAGWQFDPDKSVAVQTLMLFAFGVGMPFAVLSANAPLIQSWYAQTGGPSADDPYFLYGASNLGSLIALLAFPLVAEPLFGARQIGIGWTAGFVILGGFLALSGLAARKQPTEHHRAAPVQAPDIRQYATWLLLAFVPSSLMLAVTSKVSTDLGSFPLIWVIPLSLYLLTFVLVFTKRPILRDNVLDVGFIVSLALFVILYALPKLPGLTFVITGVLMGAFFVIALKAHRMLFIARPDRGNLTLFYVTMSVGGALGGLFNSLLAPVIFSGLQEGRVTIAIAIALLFMGAAAWSLRGVSRAILIASLVAVPLALIAPIDDLTGGQGALIFAVMLGVGLFILRGQRLRQGIVLLTVLLTGTLLQTDAALFRDRSFFGTHIVRDLSELRIYTNGTTLHGAQRLDEIGTDRRPTPLLYYHPNGPIGQIMTTPAAAAAKTIGIVGLGSGALSCYAQPGQDWHFYEIDSMVDRIARNPDIFSYIAKCAADAPTHIGDARIVLEQQRDKAFDILVIDAFSSDAVPMHLTTVEAIALYRDRITPDGAIVLHISNRYFDLQRPLGRSAADLGLTARVIKSSGDIKLGETGAVVVAMARTPAALDAYTNLGWSALETDGQRLWTDDYANLLSVIK